MPGVQVMVVEAGGTKMAITICEDIWQEHGPGEVGAVEGGASVIVNLSMSPYHRNKGHERAVMLAERAKAAHAYVCYTNGVGGQDELVFDGQSMVFDPKGELIACAPQFKEQLLLVDVARRHGHRATERGRASLPRLSWPVDNVSVSRGLDGAAG